MVFGGFASSFLSLLARTAIHNLYFRQGRGLGMKLGEKLRLARQEAGLSQRALCGDRITRNMLSLIENGTASPSVATLQYLAQRLGKPVSYFLDEASAVSANLDVMEDARQAFDRGEYELALERLRQFREPDPIFCREWELLRQLTALALAEKALRCGREPYARELLEQAEALEPRAAYALPELKARRILLQARLRSEKPEELAAELPDLDGALFLRARAALAEGNSDRCARLLDAAENQNDPDWCMLRGRVYLRKLAYTDAARCFHAAENAYPRETAAALERCYRELGDYRLAYQYACRSRELSER